MIKIQLEGIETVITLQAAQNFKILAEKEVKEAEEHSYFTPLINPQLTLDSTNNVIATLEAALGMNEPTIECIVKVDLTYILARVEAIGECECEYTAITEFMQLVADYTMSHGESTKYRIDEAIINVGVVELDNILINAQYELYRLCQEIDDVEPVRFQMDFVISELKAAYEVSI